MLRNDVLKWPSRLTTLVFLYKMPCLLVRRTWTRPLHAMLDTGSMTEVQLHVLGLFTFHIFVLTAVCWCILYCVVCCSYILISQLVHFDSQISLLSKQLVTAYSCSVEVSISFQCFFTRCTVWVKKSPLRFSDIFSPNSWECFLQILHACYIFLSTPDCKLYSVISNSDEVICHIKCDHSACVTADAGHLSIWTVALNMA